MSDLISRRDVLHELDWCDYGLKDWQKWKLKMMVRDIPLAQPEIIRCKDCKYYVIHTMFGRSEGWCERKCDEVDKLLAYEEDD